MNAVAASIETLAQRELALAMVANGRIASVSGSIAATVYAVLVYWHSQHSWVPFWLGLMFVVQGIRLAYSAHQLKQTSRAQPDTEQAVRHYTSLQLIIGVTWALAAWLFIGRQDFTLAVLLIFVYMGIGAGGMTHFSQHPKSIAAFTIPSMALALASIWQAQPIFIFLGLISLVFWYLNLQFGRQQNQQMIRALRMRYEKEELARQLSVQMNFVEQASKEKTRFFASASHDLRQPLHSLGLFGAALVSRLKDTPDGPIATNMLHCVDALENSFSSMLDVSKLDAGVVEVKSAPLAVVDVFRRLRATYERQAQAVGLSLRFKPGGKWVMADAALLERLLGNLIHNAIKFTRHGGVTVVVRSRSDASDATEMASIEVWDTGTGIPANELGHIFDEFYQVGNIERDRSRGIGMGLAIVKRLSNLMRLELQIRSQLGRGTVIKLLAPACRPPAHAAALQQLHRSPNMRALGGLHVLVIDDEEAVRNSTASALSMCGVTVTLAEGLQSASDCVRAGRARGQPIHALITDLRLRAGESGIDLVKHLRREMGYQLPALLVTGDTAPERVRQATQSGLRVLYKPVKISALIEELTLLTDVRVP
jgi:signal transduction histidine kinase/ActR/RegA family two-component response regulator